MRALTAIALCLAPLAAVAQDAASADSAPKPAAITADGIPPVPMELAAATRPYFEYRTASFSGWDPKDKSMLIATRFADTVQLHTVATPGAARRQITFEAEPVRGGSYSPEKGDVLVASKDIGGNEFYQIYRIDGGKLQLLTDGKSRNGMGAWSDDGSLLAFSSTKRNGKDTDLYVMDPRDPSTTRMLAEREGGGWFVVDFLPDGSKALVVNYISITNSELYLADVASGAIARVTPKGQTVAYGGIEVAPDGKIWATTDAGSDFKRLGTVDLKSGKFTPIIEEPWDIDEFDVSDDGRTIAYVVNAAGQTELKLYDVASKQARSVDLPPGIASGVEFARWGELGFTFISNQAAADAYSVDPATLKVTRWTTSEMGGLDPENNVLPELVEVTSFDGEKMSGFLYRPDPQKFPGKRPLIVNIHGGPEGQASASFIGRSNYYVNELGIAMLLPNVRGSSGFGKRFVALDNGPFKREDSVKDVAAFLDAMDTVPGLDTERMGVAGGSYGGYMCYASAIRYASRFKGAQCTVAISNFVTFLENTEDYRRDLRRVEYGDERDPAQRKKLLEISPLTRADEIRMPLMVATGANDPRVPASEADQVIAAVRGTGNEAWHFLAANEGHGFQKKENADYYTWAAILFWEKVLLAK